MTPDIRFRCWQGCVVGLLAVVPVMFAIASLTPPGPRETSVAIAFAIQLGLVLGIASLLVTTPTDAIRLPPERSIRLVTAGTAWLFGVAWLCSDRSPIDIVVVLLSSAVAFGLSGFLVRRRQSAWWAVVLLWNPWAVGPLAVRHWHTIERAVAGFR